MAVRPRAASIAEGDVVAVPRVSPGMPAACRLLAAAALVLAVAEPAVADQIDCTRSGTLDYFISRGSEPCGHGRGAYFDFTYSTIPSGGALHVPPESVQVEPRSTRYSDVLAFTGDWRVARGQSLEVHVGFSFEPVRLAGQGGAAVAVDPWWSPSLLEGRLCLGDEAPCATGAVYLLAGGVGGSGLFTFPAARSGGRVEMVFRVDGPQDDADVQSAAVTELSSALEVAEPPVLLLVPFGLFLAQLKRARAA